MSSSIEGQRSITPEKWLRRLKIRPSDSKTGNAEKLIELLAKTLVMSRIY
jgi:hypothetical protein